MRKWDTNIASDWIWAIPPARPSDSELVVFDEYLSKFPRKSSALILGSTPEFRDMCFCHDFDITVVDYNAETFRILGESLRHKDTAQLIVQDWRNMNLDSKFDIVVGDLATNMVSIQEQPSVFRNIMNILKSGGTLVHRAWIRQSYRYGRSNITFEEILKEHDKKRPNTNPFYSLALPFIQYYFDENQNSIDFQKMLAGLKEAHVNGLIKEDFFQAFKRPWGRYTMPNWLQTKSDLERMMSRYFVILSIEYGDDFFNEYCPIYVLKNS